MQPVATRSLSFFLLLLACATAFGQGAKVSANPAETLADRPQERARWFLRGRTLDGLPASRQLHRAYQQKLNNRALHAQPRAQSAAQDSAAAPRPMFSSQSPGGPVWTPLGPAPAATAAYNSSQQDYGPAIGRVTAVVVDQADTSGNTVYIGGAAGGVWKTTNSVSAARSCNNGICTAPVTWIPLIDGEATLTVGSIALQPGNSSLILVGTGEANNSADSYYGLGILRSTNGGASWTLISKTADNAFDFHGLGFTRIAFSTENPSFVVATAAAASGGITVGAETGGTPARGIYYSHDAGVSWLRASVTDPGGFVPDPGSANAVLYNPFTHKFYANLRYHGIYSSTDGAAWTRLGTQPAPVQASAACTPTTNSACPLYRAEMSIVPGRAANSAGEMYVWIIDNQENDQGIYQSKDGGLTWNSISTAGIADCGDSLGCGAGKESQATYNLTLAAVPNGATATDLYAAGVNQYKCSIDPASNPSCQAKPFVNLTHVYGSCGSGAVGAFAHVHPDQHGIDFSASNPKYIYFGNDGGIYRTLDGFTIGTASCNGISQQQIQFDNLNSNMGSMIQFVGFSHHPNDPATLLGGTQDNGSPAVSAASPSNGAWVSVNNGDGGFNDINAANPSEWITSNPDSNSSGNIPNIQKCGSGVLCTSALFLTKIGQAKVGGDYSSFYPFLALDPQASSRILVGTCRVWRGDSDGQGPDWAGNTTPEGTPLSFNLDTQVPASCDPAAFMVNTIAAGGPCNGSCNPGITAASGSGGGSQVVWAGMEGIADGASPSCPGGTPCGGQVWRTLAADSGPAAWSEVSGINNGLTAACTAAPSACNINPKHYPISGIALDSRDPSGRTAYVTVMGFGVGHVFKTTDAGAAWARLDGDPNATGLPDAPAGAVLADPDVANQVFVATDVGVFKSIGDGNWTELGPSSGAGSLPNVAITQLKLYQNGNDVRLRASSYGRGIWELPITGFTLTIPNRVEYAFANQTATFTGVVNAVSSYNFAIALSCASSGAGSVVPPTCTPVPASITTPGSSQAFTVTAGASSVNDFNFSIIGRGADPQNLTQQAPVAFHVVDFALGAVPAANVGAGDTADVTFSVSAQGQFTGDVALSCSGQPAGTSCTFSPAVVSLTPGAAPSVRMQIPTSAATAAGSYTVNVTGTATLGSATQSHNTALAMTLTVRTASESFSIGASAISPAIAKPGQALAASISVSASSGFTGTVDLSCVFDSGAGTPGNSTCGVSPTSVTLSGNQVLPATLTVITTGAVAANPRVVVTATDTPNHASQGVGLNYSVVDYSVVLGLPKPTVPGSSTAVGVTITALNGFAGSVAASCSAPSPLTCTLSPAGPYVLGSTTSVEATANISAPVNTAPNTYLATLNTSDTAFPSLAHNPAVSISVQDFQVATSTPSETVRAGGAPTAHVINIGALGGFSGTVTLACASGLPALTTCTFSSATVAAGGSSTLTIQTTAPTVAGARLPAGRRPTPLLAFWMTCPAFVAGLIGISGIPRTLWHTRRRLCTLRTKLFSSFGLALLLSVVMLQLGCGGGGGGTTISPPIPKPGTPAGTYTVIVTGTSTVGSSQLIKPLSITLTVQ